MIGHTILEASTEILRPIHRSDKHSVSGTKLKRGNVFMVHVTESQDLFFKNNYIIL